MGQTNGWRDRWMDRHEKTDGPPEEQRNKQTGGKLPFIDTQNCMKFKWSPPTVKRGTMSSYRYPYISIWLISAVSYDDWFCYFWVVSQTCLAVPSSNRLSHLLVWWNSYRLKNRSWRSCTEEIKKFRCCIREETQKKMARWGKKISSGRVWRKLFVKDSF